MPVVKIEVPSIGEAVTQAVIFRWTRQHGEFVEREDELVELESDKANFIINAPEKGKLSVFVKEGDVVDMGQTIGEIETFSWS